MQIIVFDLETTFTYKKNMVPEIIELGAVKIDTKANQVDVDTFQRYVSPEIQHTISDRTMKFIGLNREDMPEFIPFREAFIQFLQWMELENDYYLCTWGRDDKKLMIEHCARFGLELNWLRNYNDIQPDISTLLSDRQQMSLKDAIEAAGIIQEGRLHSALVDAIHTAHLLIKFNKKIQLKKNTPEENYFMSSPLYITCKACLKTKYYKAFGRKSKRCQNCLHYRRNNTKTVKKSGVPSL